MRHLNRENNHLRPISFEMGYIPNADGSCMMRCGESWVICTATIENKVPSFLKNSGTGWLTAEYNMLPRSTHTRNIREVTKGKASGRTNEIQRLIGRSLRAALDFKALGENQIIIDCDVINADGGTRTASITAGFLAMYQACALFSKQGKIPSMPIVRQISAISCGIVKENYLLDLDYKEDSSAQVDANFVMTDTLDIIEIQSTAEERPFEYKEFIELFSLAQEGIKILSQKQSDILKTLI